MIHLSEEQLILHYYGEAGDSVLVEQHLEACTGCRALYGSLERVLNAMDALPVPERAEGYGTQVWARIVPDLPRRRSFWTWSSGWRWAAAGAGLAALVVAAFFAGRFSPRETGSGIPAAANPQVQERILQLAVGDYLDRSQIVLTELANADPTGVLDISDAQERAANLLSENRLYRQTASRTGDSLMAGVLDELERVLLEISHAPSRLEPAQLDELQHKLRTEGVLFRIRVLGSTVRSQDQHSL